MSFLAAIAPYLAAYFVLSVCVGLVVGRIFRSMGEDADIETPEMLEEVTWDLPGYRVGVQEMAG